MKLEGHKLIACILPMVWAGMGPATAPSDPRGASVFRCVSNEKEAGKNE